MVEFVVIEVVAGEVGVVFVVGEVEIGKWRAGRATHDKTVNLLDGVVAEGEEGVVEGEGDEGADLVGRESVVVRKGGAVGDRGCSFVVFVE